MMFPGAEPAKGQFDAAYLSQARAIVDAAGTYGIYTLLDAHQDCLALEYCGEGAPGWAVTLNDSALFNSFPSPFGAPFVRDNVTGLPSYADCQVCSLVMR